MAINGTTYSYENIQVVLGSKIVAANGIEFDETGDDSEIHVLGQKAPFATISGASKYTGKIMLLMDEYDALQDSIPKGKSLRDIAAFNILVARLDSTLTLRTDRLNKCRFKKIGKSYKANENHAIIELELTIGGIDYNI